VTGSPGRGLLVAWVIRGWSRWGCRRPSGGRWRTGRSGARPPKGLALRARIVLACAEGRSNTAVAARLRVSRVTVIKWRARFLARRLGGLGAVGDGQVVKLANNAMLFANQMAMMEALRFADDQGVARETVLDISGAPAGSPNEGLPAHDLLAQARSGLVWEHYSDRPLMFALRLPTCRHQPAACPPCSSARSTIRAERYARPTCRERWHGLAPAGPGPSDRTRCSRDTFRRICGFLLSSARTAAGSSTPPGSGRYRHRRQVARDPRSDEYVAERKRAAPGETFFGDVPSVAAKARGWTSPELLDLFVEAGVACGPVLDRTECWDDPQLRQNGMIRSTPSGTEYVGNPIHWDSTLGTSNGGGGSEGKKRD
jgi:hypothetical protein